MFADPDLATRDYRSGLSPTQNPRFNDGLSRGDKARLTRLATFLVRWYKQSGRELPWRNPSASTYERICVEVLLQRTRAGVVAGIYRPFFDAFPSWKTLAEAKPRQLEDALKPIGLWRRRAISIQKLAEYAAERDGKFPNSSAELACIPAVGQYVSNAIRLFQHGERVPLLDANMARVIERYIQPRKLVDIRHDPWLQAAGHWLVRREDPMMVNWAALDLGGMLCLPRSPRCGACPARTSCRQHGL